jgi:hypothetical protein
MRPRPDGYLLTVFHHPDEPSWVTKTGHETLDKCGDLTPFEAAPDAREVSGPCQLGKTSPTRFSVSARN